MAQAKYKVGGMTCGGCARSVSAAIAKAGAGVAAEVELESGTVSVSGALSAEAVRQAVEQAGFDYLGPA